MRRKTCPASPPSPVPAPVGPLAIVLLAVALLSAVLAYAPGLDSPFLFDDKRYVHDNATLLQLWPPGWIHAGTQETRPLTNLSFALDVAAFGPEARGHHLVNLALHLASVLLLFLLVRSLRPSVGLAGARDGGLTAAVAAMILALHPAHSTSVLYIQGRPGLLSTVFALAAMLAAATAIERWERPRHRAWRTLTVALAVALAALAKETGAVVPALVLLYDVTRPARGDTHGLRERLARFHLPVWVALLPLALVYATLQNPHGGVFGAGVVDAADFYATQPLVMLLYLRLYLWPAGLSVDRTLGMLTPAEPAAWLAMLAVVILIAIVIRSTRRAPWVGLWSAWWLAAVAPTSLIPNREFVAERYLTMATPAVAALAACALAWLATRAAPRLRLAPPVALLALALVMALPLAWATRGRAQIWRSDLALWREATRVSPTNPRAWYSVGRLLFAEDSVAMAETAVRRALALGGPDLLQFLLLSDIMAAKGELDSSIVFAAAAVSTAPYKPWPHVGLARALARTGRWAEVEREAATALAIDSTSGAALYLRGRARAERGDFYGARADAAALPRLRGTNVEAAALLGLIAARAERTANADLWLARATGQVPNDQDEALAYLDAQRIRAPRLAAAGRAADAVEAWTLYLAATGGERWDVTSLLGLARALRTLGQDREAALALRQVTRLRPDDAPAWLELASLLASSRDSTLRDAQAARDALARGLRPGSPAEPALRSLVGGTRRALSKRGPG
jgi:tetratricopeptide (TPR) repeat protein